jgi:hypothetical protein
LYLPTFRGVNLVVGFVCVISLNLCLLLGC